MSHLIRLTLAADGEPFDADGVVLEDPNGEFGVLRADTEVIIVSAGTVVPNVETGVYEYELAVAPLGLTYVAWIKWTKDGVSNYVKRIYVDAEVGEDTRTLSFCVVQYGSLVAFPNGEEPTFESPGNVYGVKRQDTGAVVLAPGIAMSLVDDSSGVYVKGIEVEGSDTRLKFYVKSYVDGVYIYVQSSTIHLNGAMLAVGRYTNSARISERFGVDNMHIWLSYQVDERDDPTDLAMRAWRFIDMAERELDDMMASPYVRKGGFSVDDDYEIPELVIDMATDLAGIKMYEARGVDATDEDGQPPHRLSKIKKELMDKCKRIRLGTTRLSGSASLTPGMAPASGAYDINAYYRRKTQVNTLDCETTSEGS